MVKKRNGNSKYGSNLVNGDDNFAERVVEAVDAGARLIADGLRHRRDDGRAYGRDVGRLRGPIGVQGPAVVLLSYTT
jgi:hypothetical protein